MTKKIIIAMQLLLLSMVANAQGIKKVMNFLGSCKYEIVAGYNTTVASEPFDEAKVGYNIGVTGRKEVSTFKDGKIGAYGIVGLILTRRAGKTDNDVMTLGDSERNMSVSALSIPIHAGCEYKMKKISLFADLGPNMLFKMGADEMDNLSTNSVAFGGGFNLGIRFKRFAMSFGFDQDFTNLAKFTPSQDQKEKLELEKDKYDIKTGEFHFNLRWTLGK